MKIFVIGKHSIGKYTTSKLLEEKGVKVARVFSNRPPGLIDTYIYLDKDYRYLETQDIHNLFETKSCLFLGSDSNGEFYVGLDFMELDKNEVFFLSPNQFLELDEKMIREEVLVIWVDATYEYRLRRYFNNQLEYNFEQVEAFEEIYDGQFMGSYYNKLKSTSHFTEDLYFINEEPNRLAAIVYSILKDPNIIDLYKEE